MWCVACVSHFSVILFISFFSKDFKFQKKGNAMRKIKNNIYRQIHAKLARSILEQKSFFIALFHLVGVSKFTVGLSA